MSTKLWANTCLDFPVKRVKCIMTPYLFLRRSTRTKTTAWQVKFTGENDASVSQFWLQERLLSTTEKSRLETILLLFWSKNLMIKYDLSSLSLHIWLLKLHVISILHVDGGCEGSYAKHIKAMNVHASPFKAEVVSHTQFRQSISHYWLTNDVKIFNMWQNSK